MTYIIAEPCIDIKDRSCVDVCPVDCIHEFDRILIIDPEECIDCGACEPECPVEAIFPEDALPDKWEALREDQLRLPAGRRRSSIRSCSSTPTTTTSTTSPSNRLDPRSARSGRSAGGSCETRSTPQGRPHALLSHYRTDRDGCAPTSCRLFDGLAGTGSLGTRQRVTPAESRFASQRSRVAS